MLLDLSNDVLLDILSLVGPVDLLNVCNVCTRLRELASRIIVLNLHLSGIKCFPNLKLRPFNNLDRIRANKNWLSGKFTKNKLFPNIQFFRGRIFADEHFYCVINGKIRKYDRLWNGKYLSSLFQVIGDAKDQVTKIAKKDNVIFASCDNGTCVIFQDEQNAEIERAAISPYSIHAMDLFPKNDIYVAATNNSVRILNKRSRDTLLPVDEIPKSSVCVKIDPTGEKLITAQKVITLYDFKTMKKEDLNGLDGAWDLLWRDNHTFLSGHLDGSLKLYDLRTRSVCQRISAWSFSHNISIQYDGQNAVLCGFKYSKTVNICDLRRNNIIRELYGFNREPSLRQIVADQKHLFVVMDCGLNVCDFSG